MQLLAAVIISSCLFWGQAEGGHRALLDIIWPTKQQSRQADSKLPLQMPDMPLDHPLLVRTVHGFEPEGIHISPWQQTSRGWTMLVSWQTGESRVGKTKRPPEPHDPAEVPGVVRYGLAASSLEHSMVGATDLVYTYKYEKDVGGRTYQSPILHHVLLKDLIPGATYYYSVDELSFKVPGATHQLPIRIGIIGDLGQTPNSSATLEHLSSNNPDLVWLIGDFSYADDHCSDDQGIFCMFSTDQRRWDSWARMTQPLFSRVPVVHTNGNHEVEMQTANDFQTFSAYNARYPVPQDPSVINTSPNYAATYLDVSGNLRRFVNEADVQPNNTHYSTELPGIHLIMLSTYVPYGRHSSQYAWFLEDIASVDRERTPWLIVNFHASPRNNYVVHFKEVEEFMDLYEPLFYQHRVDLVYSGHTHAYERTFPMYNYTVDWCAPMYTCIGDGGNMEGLARYFIDDQPPDYCQAPDTFSPPNYQPSPSGEPVINFQEGWFCPDKQPKWSAHRDPSFGHGILTIHNATHAEWEWFRNQDGEAQSKDRIFVEKSPNCSLQRPIRITTVAAVAQE